MAEFTGVFCEDCVIEVTGDVVDVSGVAVLAELQE